MANQTLNPEQNKRAEQWQKWKYPIAGAFILLCIGAIFGGDIPNPPLASFYGIAAVYVIRS